jgi:hypothetical protein
VAPPERGEGAAADLTSGEASGLKEPESAAASLSVRHLIDVGPCCWNRVGRGRLAAPRRAFGAPKAILDPLAGCTNGRWWSVAALGRRARRLPSSSSDGLGG